MKVVQIWLLTILKKHLNEIIGFEMLLIFFYDLRRINEVGNRFRKKKKKCSKLNAFFCKLLKISRIFYRYLGILKTILHINKEKKSYKIILINIDQNNN